MKVLILLPPRMDGKWVCREQKAAGFAASRHNPYLAPQIAGHIRARTQGILTCALDAQADELSLDGLTSRIEVLSPDLIVCLMSAYAMRSDRLCAELDYPTIGVLCPSSIDPKEAIELYDLKTPYFVKNDPINTTVEAVREFSEKGEIVAARGMVIQRNGQVVDTGESMWDFPEEHIMPAFDMFPMEKYLLESGGKPGLISPQEGCPFSCVFCSKGRDGRVHYVDPTDITNQLRLLHDEYGYEHFHFMFSEVGANKEYLYELCSNIRNSGIRIRWSTNDRVDLVDEKSLGLMKDAGCEEICYGVETGDQALLDAMNKRTTLDQIEHAFTLTRCRGIKTSAYMMIGIPGENRESLEQSIALLKRLKPDNVYVAAFFPAPCSQIYYELKETDRLLVEDWGEYREPSRQLFVHDYYKDLSHLRTEYEWFYRRALRIVFKTKTRSARKPAMRLLYFLAYAATYSRLLHKGVLVIYGNETIRSRLLKLYYDS